MHAIQMFIERVTAITTQTNKAKLEYKYNKLYTQALSATDPNNADAWTRYSDTYPQSTGAEERDTVSVSDLSATPQPGQR